MASGWYDGCLSLKDKCRKNTFEKRIHFEYKSWLMCNCLFLLWCAHISKIWHQRILFGSFSTVRQWHQTIRRPNSSWPVPVIVVWKTFTTCIDFTIWQQHLMYEEWLKDQKMYGYQNTCLHAIHNSTGCHYTYTWPHNICFPFHRSLSPMSYSCSCLLWCDRFITSCREHCDRC